MAGLLARQGGAEHRGMQLQVCPPMRSSDDSVYAQESGRPPASLQGSTCRDSRRSFADEASFVDKASTNMPDNLPVACYSYHLPPRFTCSATRASRSRGALARRGRIVSSSSAEACSSGEQNLGSPQSGLLLRNSKYITSIWVYSKSVS